MNSSLRATGSRFVSSFRLRWRLFPALLFTMGVPFQAMATPDMTITEAVWKMLYGVTDAQLNSPAWLAADDDGDGVSNGAELAAGTNPFKAGSALKVTTVTSDTNNVYLTFPTQMGKLYVVQQSSSLQQNATWSTLTPNVQAQGTGSSMMLTAPMAGNGPFFRILVQDYDSTGDGVSDWAKNILGMNPGMSIGSQSSYTSSTLSSTLQGQDVVSVIPTDNSTTQPPDAVTPPSDLGVVTVTRSGYLLPSSITVPLIISGTAVAGTDYVALPSSVTFPAGVNSIDLKVTPIYDPNLTTSATLIVTAGAPGTAGASGNYTVGPQGSAAVTIYPAANPSGTGLTATYYAGANATYTSPVNFGGNTVTYTYSTTTKLATITYTGTGFSSSSPQNRVNLKFSTGSLAGGTFDQIYTISGTSGSTFTVPITGSPAAQTTTANVVLNPPAVTRLDPMVNNQWGYGTPNGNTHVFAGNYSVIWDGYLYPRITGNYVFQLDALDQGEVLLDTTGSNPSNQTVIVENGWTEAATNSFKQSSAISLTANTYYHITVKMVEGSAGSTGYAKCKFQWQPPGGSFGNPTANTTGTGNIFTTAAGTTAGYSASFYTNTTFTGTPSTETDTVISSSNSGDWGYGTPAPGVLIQDYYTARWTGQVLPLYSEPTTFDVNCDDGCRLYINGVQQTLLRATSDNATVAYNYTYGTPTAGTFTVTTSITTLKVGSTVPMTFTSGPLSTAGLAAGEPYTVTNVNGTTYTFAITGTGLPSSSGSGNSSWNDINLPIDWGTGYTGDRIVTLNVQAGVYYDIKLEYYQLTSNATCTLSWYNNDISKQAIPTSQLFPTMTGTTPLAGAGPAAPTAITSATSATAIVGAGPFSFALSASNGGGSFTATGLPSWLTLSNGVLSGTPTTPGTYTFTVTTTNAAGSGSAAMTIQVLGNPGTLTKDIFTTNVTGAAVSNVTWTNTPDSTGTVNVAEDNTATYGANTGVRLRGYFTPPTTGNYYFWVSAADAAELWISNNSEPCNKLRRCYVTGPTGTAQRTWTTQTTQQSGWISLTAGQNYYMEVLHNTGASGSGNNLSVGWFLDPTGNTSSPIANGAGPSSGATGGVMPGYVLSPWNNPPTITTPGSIYITNLSGATGITGSGSAYLRVNGQTAVLHLDYSGLTSGAIWRRIYAMPVGNNPPALLFDLDAQDRNYPGQKTSDGGYTWNMQASDLANLQNAQVYLSIATVNNPGGELSGTFGIIAGSQVAPAVPSYPTYADDHTSTTGAARFLNQATFGASPSDIAYVQANGYRAWIENQFNIAATHNVPYILSNLTNDPQNPYTDTLFFNSWWRNAISAQDQLRQRVAFALSEILVVSDVGTLNNNGRTEGDYYDNLLDYSFDNYRNLLKQVTLTSAMGNYLNMLENPAGSQVTGLHPNENYAREIMQLFTIGLYHLWEDGTIVLDSTGNPVPTYDQTVITGMARVFTGWSWGQQLQASGRLPTSLYPASNYLDPMVLVPNYHELGTKILLDNVMLPAATVTLSTDTSHDPNPNPITIQTTSPTLGPGNLVSTSITDSYDLNGLHDLESALNSIVGNPALGPYICRQLIQRLVTSNPSPAYVYRVVRAFNGEQNVDGVATGVTGDMKDTIRAVLLDPEARNTAAANANTAFGNGFGKQREPLMRVTGPVRAFLPTGIPNSSYRQLGGQPMLITTPTPHRQVSGDTVFLDTFVDSGSSTTNLPSTSGYSVVNSITPTYSLASSTGVITLTFGSAPGYQTGDSVAIQFTSGTLGATSPYSGVQNYTLAASGTPTVFTTTIAPNAVSGNPSGSAFTPYNFTVNNLQDVAPSYTGNYLYSGSGTTVTITATGYAAGNQVTLTFASGGLFGGTHDGVYTIATATTSNFTVTVPGISGSNSGTVIFNNTNTITFNTTGPIVGQQLYVRFFSGQLSGGTYDGIYTVAASTTNNFTVNATIGSPPSVSSGTALVPKYTGGYNITNAGSTSTISIQTNTANALKAGDSVWIDFLVSNGGTNPAVSGIYTVNAVQGPNIFNVTVSPVVTAGSQSTSGQAIYPLYSSSNLPPWTRNGTCTVDFSTWNMGGNTGITQVPLDSPTVFNYFYPNYEYPGILAAAGMTTPEFQLTNDSNTMNLTNFITAGVVPGVNTNGFASFNSGSGVLVYDFGSYVTASATSDANIGATVDAIAAVMVGGPLASGTRSAIISYVANTGDTNFPLTPAPPTNAQMSARIRAIIHLIATSAEYAIQK